MMREIVVDIEVFAHIWKNRLEDEHTENQILKRLLGIDRSNVALALNTSEPNEPIYADTQNEKKFVSSGDLTDSIPPSKKWTDVLIWTLTQLGGSASLDRIYEKSREARLRLRVPPTKEHNASARECLESHCSDSDKYRGKEDIFWMPEGKGAGVWALR